MGRPILFIAGFNAALFLVGVDQGDWLVVGVAGVAAVIGLFAGTTWTENR